MRHVKMRAGRIYGAHRRWSVLNFNHVIDPHFVTFSNSLYTTICNPNSNPNRNPTVITDPQIDPRDPQIVTVQIRPAPILLRAPKDQRLDGNQMSLL